MCLMHSTYPKNNVVAVQPGGDSSYKPIPDQYKCQRRAATLAPAGQRSTSSNREHAETGMDGEMDI